MNQTEYRIQSAARDASRVISYDKDREKAFIDGAMFAVRELMNSVSECSQEAYLDKSTKRYLDKLKISSVREFVEHMLTRVDNSTSDNDVQPKETK